jgi:1,4-dihydroxy-2-naphthoyl-CoA hydrolase
MGVFDHYDRDVAETMLRGHSYGDGSVGGGLPSYLKIETTSVEPGRLTCELPVTEELLNPFGAAHGGVVSALIDHALGAVCLPVIAKGSWPATQEFKLNFIAPARPGPMVAEANIVSMSKRTVIVRIDVSNNGRLVCAAQGTVAVMPPRP